MPAATKKAAPAEPDLLSGLTDDTPDATPEAADNQVYDLLDGLSEDEGTAWIPDDEDDPSPEGIQGRVTYRGEIPSDYGPEPVPVVELKAPDGEQWSIRGYSTALRNQIIKEDPQPGDWAAFRYFGVKTGKKSGREYKNFKCKKQRA